MAAAPKYSASAVSAATAAALEYAPAQSVELSLQALLKIMQHARDVSAPQSATGQLLGMDTGHGVIEVTETFPFETAIQDDAEQEEYQLDMVKLLRDVNVDHCTVGWYQVSAFDAAIGTSLIEAQISYQASVPNCVLIVYDHVLSSAGAPALRALRLRDDFVRAFRERRTREVAEFVGLGMFDVLPVRVRLSAGDRLLLAQMASDGSFPAVGVATTPEVALKQLAGMCDSVTAVADDAVSEMGRLAYALRSSAKQQHALAAQLGRLRTENAQRVQAGDEPLPVATVMANFRPATDPSRMPALLASSNLHVLLDELPVVPIVPAATAAPGTPPPPYATDADKLPIDDDAVGLDDLSDHGSVDCIDEAIDP